MAAVSRAQPRPTRPIPDWRGPGPRPARLGCGSATSAKALPGPVIVGERLILFHRVGEQDVVEACEAATGKSLWKQASATDYSERLGKGDGPRSTPCVVGDRVYTLAANGRLQCLDLATGELIWHHELLKDYMVRPSFFGVGTSPLVEGDLVVINVGGRNGAGIVAFDRKTGKEVWKATDQDASYSSPVAATFDGVVISSSLPAKGWFPWTRRPALCVSPSVGVRAWTPRSTRPVRWWWRDRSLSRPVTARGRCWCGPQGWLRRGLARGR